EELAGIHDSGRVELLLDRPQRLEPERSVLGLEVVDVVAADGVVVRDRPARRHDGLAGGALGRLPLLGPRAALLAGGERQLQRAAPPPPRTWRARAVSPRGPTSA